MYGIDGDTQKLLRYVFGRDEFKEVGVVTNQWGQAMGDFESLAYVPEGPHRGFYTSVNSGPYARRLIRVSGLDASAYVYPSISGPGFIRGMAAMKRLDGQWTIMAVTTRANATIRELVSIDPATGLATWCMDLGRIYEGIAVDAPGALYGVVHDTASDHSELWIIDPDPTDGAFGPEDRVGGNAWPRVEALEFAFGDNTPPIEGLPPPAHTWDHSRGVLFAFSDDADELLVINTTNGQGAGVQCAFATIDCEGLVFLTVARDPYDEVTEGFD
jgi:hypothetical protein